MPFNRRIKALARQWLAARAAPGWDADALDDLVGYARSRFRTELLPWQLVAFGLLVSWRDAAGAPTVRVLVVQVARGAGKSQMSAILSGWVVERARRAGQVAEVVLLATQMQAAKIVWDRMRGALGEDPEWRFLGGLTTTSIAMAQHPGGVVRCKPSTPKNADGISPQLVILDEAARIEDETYGRALSSLSKVPGSQALVVTTPDRDQHRRGYGSTVRALERAYDDGEAPPEGVAGMLFGIDPEDSPTDPVAWAKAQPGLGVTKPVAEYELQRRLLLDNGSPRDREEFWTQQLATFTDDLAGAMPLALWDACVGEWSLEDARGLPAVIGVDFSQGGWSDSQMDLTSVCLSVWDGARVLSRSWHYWSGPSIEADERKCRQPLREWRDSGQLVVSGNVIDYSVVEAQVLAIASVVDLRHFVADPAGKAAAWCDAMERRHGWRWSRAPQNHVYMGSAWAVWADLVRGRRVMFHPDPVFRANLAHARLVVTDRGLAVPSKGRSSSNIDAVTAAIMAAKVMNDHELLTESLYGDPGRISF